MQRQTAASRLARPLRSAQQGLFGGEPPTMLTKPSKSEQTPSLSVSVGQVGLTAGSFFGDFGGLGVVVGGHLEVTNVKKRRLSVRRRAVTARALEAIDSFSNVLEWLWRREVGTAYIEEVSDLVIVMHI